MPRRHVVAPAEQDSVSSELGYQHNSDSLASYYRGYACPQEDFNEQILNLIVSSHANHLVTLFIEHFSDNLSITYDGIDEFFLANKNFKFQLPDAWDPLFGYILASLQSKVSEASAEYIAPLAIHLMTAGAKGDFCLRLPQPTRLRWQHYLLPNAEILRVQSDGSTATVSSEKDAVSQTVKLTRRGEARWRSENCQRLPHFRTGYPPFTILPPEAIVEKDLSKWCLAATSALSPDLISGWEAACDYLNTGRLFAYRAWVARLIRYLILVESKPGQMLSGSFLDRPGLITASARLDPLEMLEILIHEGTHQYFNVLTRVGNVDDGTDTRLYYSPSVRAMRPLNRILFAYHAFANIYLFYQLVKENGLDQSGFVAKYEQMVLDDLRQLQEVLVNNKALTIIGRSILEPLATRINL